MGPAQGTHIGIVAVEDFDTLMDDYFEPWNRRYHEV